MLPQWEKADQQSQLRHPTRSRDQDDETSTRLECSRLRSSGNVGMRMEKKERRRQRLSCLGGVVEHHHPITRDAFLVDKSSLLSPIVKRERTFIAMISPPSIHASTKHDSTRQVIHTLRQNITQPIQPNGLKSSV